MKTLSSKWLLALAVFATAALVSCGDDDNNTNPPTPDEEVEADNSSMLFQLTTGQTTISFSYNVDGTINEIDDGHSSLRYVYDYSRLESDHKITVRGFNSDNEEQFPRHEFDLADGRVVAQRNVDAESQTSNEVTYTYDEQGQLIGRTMLQWGAEERISWENGVITKVEDKYGEEGWRPMVSSIQYSKVKVGRYGRYFDLTLCCGVLRNEIERGLLQNGMFGTPVKYFPVAMSIVMEGINGSLKFSSNTSAIPSSLTFQGVTQQINWMKRVAKK
jgi:YD repeat-containing protein